MPAGFYTECAAVLFARAPSLDEISLVLPRATRRPLRGGGGAPWFGGDDLVLDIDPARNGWMIVDVVRAPWPDAMGHPKDDPQLFGAWSLGAFGRYAFPGNFTRACEQAWGVRETAESAATHVAFVRLRTTYVMGAEGDAPLEPEDRSWRTDHDAVLDAALAVLRVPGALAYFDPTAELLLPGEEMEARRAFARTHARVPIELVSHARLFRPDASHSLLDTIGMARADLPDLEVPFALSQDANEMLGFVRNVSLYHLDRGEPIPSGDTVDGPGGRYRVHAFDEALVEPPRPVLRLLLDGNAFPEVLRAAPRRRG